MAARQQRGRKNVLTAFVDHCSQEREIAARDDARCREAGTKPGTPAYAKCLEDMSNRRHMSEMAMRIGMQNQIWSQQEMTRNQMMMGR